MKKRTGHHGRLHVFEPSSNKWTSPNTWSLWFFAFHIDHWAPAWAMHKPAFERSPGLGGTLGWMYCSITPLADYPTQPGKILKKTSLSLMVQHAKSVSTPDFKKSNKRPPSAASRPVNIDLGRASPQVAASPHRWCFCCYLLCMLDCFGGVLFK